MTAVAEIIIISEVFLKFWPFAKYMVQLSWLKVKVRRPWVSFLQKGLELGLYNLACSISVEKQVCFTYLGTDIDHAEMYQSLGQGLHFLKSSLLY